MGCSCDLLLQRVGGIGLVVTIISVVTFFIFKIGRLAIRRCLIAAGVIRAITLRSLMGNLGLAIYSDLVVVSCIFCLVHFMGGPTRGRGCLPFFILVICLLFMGGKQRPITLLTVVCTVCCIEVGKVSLGHLTLNILPLVKTLILLSFGSGLISSLVRTAG